MPVPSWKVTDAVVSRESKNIKSPSVLTPSFQVSVPTPCSTIDIPLLFESHLTSSGDDNEVVPIPTLLFDESTDKVPESISKSEAVTVPVILISPVPVISLEFKSKSPPS